MLTNSMSISTKKIVKISTQEILDHIDEIMLARIFFNFIARNQKVPFVVQNLFNHQFKQNKYTLELPARIIALNDKTSVAGHDERFERDAFLMLEMMLDSDIVEIKNKMMANNFSIHKIDLLDRYLRSRNLIKNEMKLVKGAK